MSGRMAAIDSYFWEEIELELMAMNARIEKRRRDYQMRYSADELDKRGYNSLPFTAIIETVRGRRNAAILREWEEQPRAKEPG
ncbi:MAG: hypothetical protein LC793_18535 [Thermomicrobia bacterium]|nr:hypothetical protein [Thermomicrobia bacterium]